MPFEIVTSRSIGVTLPSASSRYRVPAHVVQSRCIVPAQNRPRLSQAPSFMRISSRSDSTSARALTYCAVVRRREAVPRRQHVAARRPRHHGADASPDLEAAVGPGHGVEAVDDALHDVDPHELAGPVVPQRPLAQLGASVADELRGPPRHGGDRTTREPAVWRRRRSYAV